MNDSASIPAAEVIEAMQVDDVIASISTPECVDIGSSDLKRSSLARAVRRGLLPAAVTDAITTFGVAGCIKWVTDQLTNSPVQRNRVLYPGEEHKQFHGNFVQQLDFENAIRAGAALALALTPLYLLMTGLNCHYIFFYN
ncbi:hypothetical protein EVAR_25278_1 [Eumeta japonica]|uniref:Uncharacterized protein n=1 Tax=Eumeta variegata TaxID=151549 RepID=A0A4C1VMT6_EUMVA|nr:hypothetical protein EVAR_25278_1 [Eumeta japonica]